MTFNIGEFIFNIIKILKDLASKLYDVVNYQVNIEFINKIMSFFGSDLDIPNSISLLSIIGSLGAVTLVVLIIYNIFKL